MTSQLIANHYLLTLRSMMTSCDNLESSSRANWCSSRTSRVPSRLRHSDVRCTLSGSDDVTRRGLCDAMCEKKTEKMKKQPWWRHQHERTWRQVTRRIVAPSSGGWKRIWKEFRVSEDVFQSRDQSHSKLHQLLYHLHLTLVDLSVAYTMTSS